VFCFAKIACPATSSSGRGYRLCCDRLKFQKRSQLFIRAHNVTLAIVAMRVSNPDCSPVRINRCGLFERISFFENFVPQIPDKQVSPASSNKHARQEKENQKSGQSL